VNDRRFLAARGAAGDEDQPRRRHPEVSQHRVNRDGVRRGSIERVELQAPGDGDACRVGAKVDQPALRLLALDAEALDVGEHTPEQRPNQPIAPGRPGRESSVDHCRADALSTAFAQQIRPDLRLHHHEELRPDARDRAAHGERPVEGKVEDPVDVLHAALRDLLPRARRRREKDAQRWIALLELGDDRACRHHLTHRDRLDPDRLVARRVERHRQVAEPLSKAGDVFVPAQSLNDEVRREQDGGQERGEAVEEIHANPRKWRALRCHGV
jgi:hypothetical protein